MMEDLSYHVLDLAENAVNAGATRIIILINENAARDVLTIRVADNGRGMPADAAARAFDPFFTTQRKRTGLGLALLAQAARQCGGDVALAARPGGGTRVAARFRYRHIDRQPLTKMTETMMMLLLGHPEIDFHYRHRRNGRSFSFVSHEFFLRSGRASSGTAALSGAVRLALRDGLRRIGAS
jgi:anti-sigma regulatory factor (Ser/Thr protein kinase)